MQDLAGELFQPGHPEIFVGGDLANCSHQTGQPPTGMAAVAMAQGRYVARAILAGLHAETPPPFHYFDKGTPAAIGRNKHVAWLFVHLTYLVEFDNRR